MWGNLANIAQKAAAAIDNFEKDMDGAVGANANTPSKSGLDVGDGVMPSPATPAPPSKVSL